MSRTASTLLTTALSLALCAAAFGQASGRYVYIGNALSERMRLTEVEVYSGGKNVIYRRPETITRGMDAGFYRFDREAPEIALKSLMLVDGDVDTRKTGADFGSLYAVGAGNPLRNSSFEIDLGEAMPIERIGVYVGKPQEKVAGDLGWRLVAVLSASRRVVAWQAFNVYGPEAKGKNGKWMLDIEPTRGGLTGRHVEPGQGCWLTEVEFLHECLGKPMPPRMAKPTAEQAERLRAFRSRNDPKEIEALAERFFGLAVDLDHPSMAKVKPLVEQKRYAEAFEAFKRPTFELLKPMGEWDGGWKSDNLYTMYGWPMDPDSLAVLQAKDLRAGFRADLGSLTIERVDPRLTPMSMPDFPMPSRPLLVDYALNNNRESLQLWQQMVESWSISFQDAADKNPGAYRDYFVLDVGQIPRHLRDLYEASQANPRLVDEMSGVTLARMLLPMLEELPVAAWRVNRKGVFNHTFNAIPGGLWTCMFMPQFRAVQRLQRESQQGFTKLSTLSSYRDGPMVEMGDEGHFAMQLGTPIEVYGILKHYGQADWLTPAKEKYFLDQYRKSMLFSLRHLSQTGVGVRYIPTQATPEYIQVLLDIKDPKWANFAVTTRMNWGQTYPAVTTGIAREPQPRAMIDTVFGRGRDTQPDRTRQRMAKQIGEFYGGSYKGEPDFESDFLPYAGLWYFRGGWDVNDPYLHMMNPPISTSGSVGYTLSGTPGAREALAVPTSHRFADYATPLLTSLGVQLDNLPPCPREGRYPTGSKQDVFSQAVEKPQFSRWHSGPVFDFGEATYRGNYRVVERRWDSKIRKPVTYASPQVVEDVAATRQILQVRPARLFLQVDRLKYADPSETHVNKLVSAVQLFEPGNDTGKKLSDEDQLQIDGQDRSVRTSCPDNAGLSIHFFGQSKADVAYDVEAMRHPRTTQMFGPCVTYAGMRRSTGRDVMTTWKATGQTVLISAFRANAPGEMPIRSTRDLSTDQVAGAEILTEGDVKTTLLVARNAPAQLSLGAIRVSGEALLVVEEPGQPVRGIALGAVSTTVGGRAVADAPADFVFEQADGAMSTSPILKPIDPPTISPAISTFIGNAEVSITSDTPDVEIYYTTDGSDPTPSSTRYAGPFTISNDAFVQARAFRKGVDQAPFTIDGTLASEISYAEFTKQAPLPAVKSAPTELTKGLSFDYLEDRWFALWTYTNELPAVSTGQVDSLLDVSMRKTDGPFAVRYKGYIDVPDTGVYTFYGPDEFVNNTCEPGYDLRVYVDGKQWNLGQMWHDRGTWSIALEAGLHEFMVTFADARARDIENQRVDLWHIPGHMGYPQAATVWRGTAPVLEVSQPGGERQPLPNDWMKH